MRNLSLLILLSLCWWSCEKKAATDTAGIRDNGKTEGTADLITDHEDKPGTSLISCDIDSAILVENSRVLRQQKRLVSIHPHPETAHDAPYRELRIWSLPSCTVEQRQLMPETDDFSYYLADISYDHANQLIGMRNGRSVCVYDLEQQAFLETLEPDFGADAMYQDAQSGIIDHLEVWEDIVFGYARDLGAFGFDLRDRAKPKPIVPVANYTHEGAIRSLFLIADKAGNYQAIIPDFSYNYEGEEDKFELYPLFSSPQSLDPQPVGSTPDGRMVDFERLATDSEGKETIVIDLMERKVQKKQK